MFGCGGGTTGGGVGGDAGVAGEQQIEHGLLAVFRLTQALLARRPKAAARLVHLFEEVMGDELDVVAAPERRHHALRPGKIEIHAGFKHDALPKALLQRIELRCQVPPVAGENRRPETS